MEPWRGDRYFSQKIICRPSRALFISISFPGAHAPGYSLTALSGLFISLGRPLHRAAFRYWPDRDQQRFHATVQSARQTGLSLYADES